MLTPLITKSALFVKPGATAGRCSKNNLLLLLLTQSDRCQGTNFSVNNPSSKIRNERLRDEREMDGLTRVHVRPCLPESIVPPYDLPPKACPPWPYRERGYGFLFRAWDWTMKRFDENTRLVCVEGNYGTNCGKFARELAQKLDFHFIPQPTIEDILVDRYGIDKRNYYHLLPEKFCLFDTEMFFYAPDHPMVNMRAWILYSMKFEAYCNAMAHIFNTGQGVVLERSVFSDSVFARAMNEKKFVSDYYGQYYTVHRENNLHALSLKPHLIVYLDAPVSVCMENIKQRARPWEMNSKVTDYDYLSIIEDEYKRHLKIFDNYSHLLIVDWKKPVDVDSVAEDIYNIDLVYNIHQHQKCHEWNMLNRVHDFNELRYQMTQKHNILDPFLDTNFQVSELYANANERLQLQYVMSKLHGKYCMGYNRERGDKLGEILWDLNNGVRMVPGERWVEYTFKDNFWCGGTHEMFTFDMPTPNIPDQEFEPRRFDPRSLINWDHHH